MPAIERPAKFQKKTTASGRIRIKKGDRYSPLKLTLIFQNQLDGLSKVVSQFIKNTPSNDGHVIII